MIIIAGFAVIALVELIYETNSPRWLLLMIGVSWAENGKPSFVQVITVLLAGANSLTRFDSSSGVNDVHMHSTIHADIPGSWWVYSRTKVTIWSICMRIKDQCQYYNIRFYIDLSWLFSTCVGLIILLAEIGLIFYYQFRIDGFEHAGWMTLTIMSAYDLFL